MTHDSHAGSGVFPSTSPNILFFTGSRSLPCVSGAHATMYQIIRNNYLGPEEPHKLVMLRAASAAAGRPSPRRTLPNNPRDARVFSVAALEYRYGYRSRGRFASVVQIRHCLPSTLLTNSNIRFVSTCGWLRCGEWPASQVYS